MAKKSKIMPPSSNKYKKVKRPTVLVKRNQLKRKSISKPRNLLYEKLKANNNALARALSKEKQDHQYTFSHSLALTSQIQEMQISLNKRDEILSKILQNSKQGLELLVKATGYLTDTIQSCRSIVQTEPFNLRISSSRSPMPRRESSRQSVVKSPARGVVQPMVSGHTITKPVINLSRINMPRIRTSPNLSDIEESIISTPERSSLQTDNSSTTATTNNNNNNNNNNSTATSFIRLPPVNQQNGFPTRRVERLLPERIRVSAARISDEIDDLSDNNNISRRSTSRRTSRHSRRESRNSERLSVVNLESRFNNETLPEMFKSPRVALQDVSRFLRNNTQTINVKTFMENGNTINNINNNKNNNSNSVSRSEDNTIVESSNDRDISVQDNESTVNVTDKLSESWTAPTYGFDSKKHETKKSNNGDDPLEGPSWMHNSEPIDIDQNNSDADNNIQVSNCSRINPSETYVISSSSSAAAAAVAVAASAQIDEPTGEDDPNDSSQIEWAKNSCTVSSSSSDDDNDDDNDNYNVDDNKSVNYSKYLSVNTRARRINNYVSNDNDNINTTRNVSKYSSADRDTPKSRKFSTRVVDDGDNDDNGDNDDGDDDDEKCGDWGRLAASINTRPRKTDDFENNDLLRVSTNVTVARSRQPIDDDDDDFTMIIKKRPCPTRNLPFDINELDLPVLERPLIETPQVEPEPDFTTEINMLTRIINMPATPRTSIRESLMDSINNSSALIPQINESIELENYETIENTRDSFIGHPDVLKRKRINKYRFASSSDSEPSSPLEKVSKSKRKNVKRKDPSSAKVVLEKLDESNKKITSITSRNSSNSTSSLQLDQQSDSDSSNASSRISGRPRRRKAPTNLKEPRLGTKLRRQ
ncbi:probable serine/threonine-protein kinase DDB_G0282963 isoform X2 [Microplitis mediator]|uniref:probable serine/threonine-protein kinase DDB_G0282963 isoform X2 n=1 Tax=Microplitis mediator TaxID=375433 RepID=UPI0025521328|nr:probable serine/threonine-protein kinase DDB_G0282963 isoform X2 [Microplitis mediator]